MPTFKPISFYLIFPYDKVSHQRLLSKLSHYGIAGSIFDWIKDFLLDRKKQVVLLSPAKQILSEPFYKELLVNVHLMLNL